MQKMTSTIIEINDVENKNLKIITNNKEEENNKSRKVYLTICVNFIVYCVTSTMQIV